MNVTVSEAKGRLTDLVRRAEAGALARHGRVVARIVPAAPGPGADARRALLDAVRASAARKAASGLAAAQSVDFLSDEDGLPR